MPVDISNVLHVLAHELRTPTGIAHGYLRMLVDDRLTDPADRQRALEQTQHAVARISELTHESTRLANWQEAEHAPLRSIDARTLVEDAVAALEIAPAPELRIALDAPAPIATVDGEALRGAVTALVVATARELRTRTCAVRVGVNGGSVDLLIGDAEHFDQLAQGPEAAGAGALALERGGLGLSLIFATAVLDTHRARHWTVADSRTTVGVRLPLTERAQP
jgi:signal transduction histidine kinase